MSDIDHKISDTGSKKIPGMTISEAEVNAWGTWLRAVGRPETTIGLRTYHVTRAFREIETDPYSLGVDDLITWLATKTWQAETRRSYLSSLRAFYRWCQATGRRADNPAALLPSVKPPRGVPRPTPDLIYWSALEAADDRTRLMVRLAAVCGLRRGEIAVARREHMVPDLVGWSLYVTGKGGHARTVPVPDDLAHEISRMPAGWLFPSTSTRGGRAGAHLTPAHVGKLVSSVLPDGWTCHTLRHRCATVAYAAERDLRAVQELLGHAKPETTARYTKVPMDAVRRAVAAAAAAAERPPTASHPPAA